MILTGSHNTRALVGSHNARASAAAKWGMCGGGGRQLGHTLWYPKIRENHIGRDVVTLL